jgi:hypothetical protein
LNLQTYAAISFETLYNGRLESSATLRESQISHNTKTCATKKQQDIRGRFAEYQSEKAIENCMQIFAFGVKILMTAVKVYLFPNTRSTFQGET